MCPGEIELNVTHLATPNANSRHSNFYHAKAILQYAILFGYTVHIASCLNQRLRLEFIKSWFDFSAFLH